jgi:nicotinamide riboside kinase
MGTGPIEVSMFPLRTIFIDTEFVLTIAFCRFPFNEYPVRFNANVPWPELAMTGRKE